MSLTYALEAAVNGTTGPRATLFDGLESHQAATASIRTTTNAGDSHPAEAVAVAARGTFRRSARARGVVRQSRHLAAGGAGFGACFHAVPRVRRPDRRRMLPVGLGESGESTGGGGLEEEGSVGRCEGDCVAGELGCFGGVAR